MSFDEIYMYYIIDKYQEKEISIIFNEETLRRYKLQKRQLKVKLNKVINEIMENDENQ